MSDEMECHPERSEGTAKRQYKSPGRFFISFRMTNACHPERSEGSLEVQYFGLADSSFHSE